ncbi:oligosaccharide repeat unit polymerase [[Clostridium] aminophilum]|uniref:O-antigen polymerase n=1 Tax=[Clostridium] aminophilum TaxID=1526 RepID=UPI00332304F5
MIIYPILYAAAYLASAGGHTILAGLELGIAAIYLFAESVKRSGSLCDLRGLFSLSFSGGEALAVMRLSYLSSDWSPVTWFSFFAAQMVFLAAWELTGLGLEGRGGFGTARGGSPETGGWNSVFGGGRSTVFEGGQGKWGGHSAGSGDSARHAVAACAFSVAAVSFLSFLFEAFRLGYVPLFVRGVPHAYSEFHLMGVHYITVSCVLVPGLDMIYLKLRKDAGEQFSVRVRSVGSINRFHFLNGNMIGKRDLFFDRLAELALILSLAVPILCVSRFQMMFGILIAVAVYVRMFDRIRPWMLPAALAVIAVLFAVLSVARSHDAAYLNQVFEMKNEHMPVFFSQPYIYIANNYENFDYMVRALAKHSMGAKSMMPLLTFTGIKFLKPELVEWPMYFVKEELTTTTILYDAYYDFGIPGVILFSALLGGAARWIAHRTEKCENPVMFLIYGQAAVYLLLAFFTTWFSLPVTWFYFGVTAAAAIAVGLRN